MLPQSTDATTTTTPSLPTTGASSSSDTTRGVWSQQEHDLFLEALQKFPNGPWKAVADHVGTRSVRQVQTHAQKYHEKVARRLRGLRKDRKRVQRPEHRLDDDMIEIVSDLQQDNALLAPKPPAGKRRRQRSAKGIPVMHANVTGASERGYNTLLDLDDGEETKLAEGMDSVHVRDSFGEDGDSMSAGDWLSAIEPADAPLDDLDASFFEIIDYLIEALSSSESETE